ncbi:ribosome hibernation-promoting factor, HPF/YfiA family [Actinocatenispora comari]|uniref:Ribosome hibernation promoting factor n=1 Tax=Actinocatenispora comari TaxID=2807577 RepID=A0A8J4ADF5_9ACTN|nr:ribosome-associated translation inhibitor RaiA [Actinocatenispora comari]GIL28665.1 ribosomal subunit interface protein [Actinocatenispora comari]
MDVVIKGRNLEVPDHFRQLITDKMNKIGRYDPKMFEVDVELSHERNRRQSGRCQRVEITCRSRGPAVRAEACAGDFYSALDASLTKLESRLRKSADRRRVHRGRRTPESVAAATAALGADSPVPGAVAVLERTDELAEVEHEQGPGRIVREKEHPADPMTVDDALFQMELVGHDFYLFMDKESGRPSVVYRRKGFDYGILRLTS